MGLDRYRLSTCMLIALMVLAGCSTGSDGDDDEPSTTNESQVPGEDSANPAETDDGTVSPPGQVAESTTVQSPTQGVTSVDADGDGFMTADELRVATNAAMPEFPMPPEYQVTGDMIVDQFLGSIPPEDAEAEPYQVQLEITLIGSHHQCAWERVYLQANASGDTARQQEALDELVANLA